MLSSFVLVRPVVAADVPGTEPVSRSRHPQTAELRKTSVIDALTVVGDSMIDAAICDGDIVTVRKMDSADHGDIVAALLDDEAIVKVLRRQDGRIWLMPRNPAYQPIPGDQAQFLGKVVGALCLL